MNITITEMRITIPGIILSVLGATGFGRSDAIRMSYRTYGSYELPSRE